MAFFLICCTFIPVCSSATSRRSGRTVELKVTEGADIRFVRLSTPQGLSDSAIFNILQDDYGFMWIGTPNGLNRYDGYDFRVFRPGPSNGGLSGTTIIGLAKDRAGALWFGADQYLNRFDPVTERVTEYRSDPSQPDALGGSVNQVAQDLEGNIWVATSTGLDKLNSSTGAFTHYRHSDADPHSLDANGSDAVTFVTVDRSGTLWVETSAGVNSLDPKTGRATRYPELRNQTEFHNQEVYQDHSGLLWIYSREGSGIGTFNPNTLEFVRFKFITHDPGTPTAEKVTSVIEDEHGTIWLGTGGSGLLRYDPHGTTVVRYRSETSDPYSLSNNFVLALCEDREGGIWVGTGGGGVNYFSSTPHGFKVYRKVPGNKNSLDQNFVLSTFEDNEGILWVGNDGVLNRIDSRTGRFRFYRHKTGDPNSISDGTVLSTVEDKAGTLWFATHRGGLDSFDRKTGKFRSFHHTTQNADSPNSDVIMRLQLDRTGLIWVATDHGVDQFDPVTKHFTHYPGLNKVLADTRVTCFALDSHGVVWLGTSDQGIVRFDPASGQWELYPNDSSRPGTLSNDHVNTLLVDTSGTLWAGTQQGLNRLDRDSGTFRTYNESDGLPGSAVQGILEDGERNLWLSAGAGIAKFNPRTRAVRNYYAADGIAGNDFNYWNAPFKSGRGEMYFPGVHGLTIFKPERISEETDVAPIVLTDFGLFGLSVRVGTNSPLQRAIFATQNITLSHSQSVFSFEFSSLSYTYPERNRYRHMLEGLESQWNETDSKHRVAAYTTLAPGEYVLRVQGSSSRGIWNEQGVSLHIRVLPPWWRSWWFRVAVVVAIAALAFTVHRFRVRGLKRVNRLLRFFADIINSSDDAVIAATLAGVITHWNRGAEQLYGYRAEEAISKNVVDLTIPMDRKQEFFALLSRIEQGRPALHYETVRLKRDGHAIQVLTTASPIHDQNGTLVGVSVIQRDITERKQAEDEIRALSERLINAQEQERARIARELHDNLNQQIAAISLGLGAARRKFLESQTDGQQQLQNIRAQLDDLANAVRELSHDLHPTVLDYSDIAAALRSHCKDFSALTGIEVVLEENGRFEDLPPDVALCIYRVAQEALQNIARHAQTRSARLRLQRSENNVTLIISDTGIGFEPNRARESGGLGLVSIRERVRLKNGRVELHSAPSKGTTLKIEIPLATDTRQPTTS